MLSGARRAEEVPVHDAKEFTSNSIHLSAVEGQMLKMVVTMCTTATSQRIRNLCGAGGEECPYKLIVPISKGIDAVDHEISGHQCPISI